MSRTITSNCLRCGPLGTLCATPHHIQKFELYSMSMISTHQDVTIICILSGYEISCIRTSNRCHFILFLVPNYTSYLVNINYPEFPLDASHCFTVASTGPRSHRRNERPCDAASWLEHGALGSAHGIFCQHRLRPTVLSDTTCGVPWLLRWKAEAMKQIWSLTIVNGFDG